MLRNPSQNSAHTPRCLLTSSMTCLPTADYEYEYEYDYERPTPNAQTAEAQKRTRDSGTRTFQAKDIIWSIRRRGTVQRIHIITVISSRVFSTNQTTPGSQRPSQPPKKRTTPNPAVKKLFANSARKKKDQRIPEYSVWNPATSSDSASGRSKGARLTSAIEATRYIRNPGTAMGAWRMMFQRPSCCRTSSIIDIVPAMVTIESTTTSIGIS